MSLRAPDIDREVVLPRPGVIEPGRGDRLPSSAIVHPRHYVIPPQGPGLLSADAGQQAQRYVGVQARALGCGQQGLCLLQGQALRRPAGPTPRRFHQRGDIACDDLVGLGVPDRTVQRVAGDLEGPGGVAGCELAQSGPDVACAEVSERTGSDDLQYRLQQALIYCTGPLGPSIQTLPEPVLHRITDRIARRRSDPGLELLVQRLELVPDVLLSPAVDLPADPLALGRVAERDGPHVPVLRRREVDRILAVPPA